MEEDDVTNSSMPEININEAIPAGAAATIDHQAVAVEEGCNSSIDDHNDDQQPHHDEDDNQAGCPISETVPMEERRRARDEIHSSGEEEANTAICSVCSAETMNDHFHYGAICCFSCKQFFRRANQGPAGKTSPRGFVCKFGGKCEVGLQSKSKRGRCGKICRKCRYDKCLAVGMNETKVLSKDKKEFRFRKKLTRQRREAIASHGNADASANTSSANPIVDVPVHIYCRSSSNSHSRTRVVDLAHVDMAINDWPTTRPYIFPSIDQQQ